MAKLVSSADLCAKSEIDCSVAVTAREVYLVRSELA